MAGGAETEDLSLPDGAEDEDLSLAGGQ